MLQYDLVIVGAGVSGLTAAIEAKKNGVDKVLVLDREMEPGGVLNNCIHTGFYYEDIKENLTTTELIQILVDKAIEIIVLPSSKSKNGFTLFSMSCSSNSLINFLIFSLTYNSILFFDCLRTADM